MGWKIIRTWTSEDKQFVMEETKTSGTRRFIRYRIRNVQNDTYLSFEDRAFVDLVDLLDDVADLLEEEES